MKINEVIQGTPSISTPNKNGKQESGEMDFKKILSNASAKLVDPGREISSTASEDGRKIFSTAALPMPPLNGLLNSGDAASIRSKGLQTAENTLKTLEAYQNALGNPEISLKKVDQIVQLLSKEVDRLKTLSEQIPISDPLHQMMTEAGIISAVEIERFHRGEYL